MSATVPTAAREMALRCAVLLALAKLGGTGTADEIQVCIAGFDERDYSRMAALLTKAARG